MSDGEDALFASMQREIFALEARIKELEATGWQPVETAPRDGHFIFLSDGHIMRIGFWCEATDRWIDMIREEAKGPSDLLFKPAFWQRLPSPPEAA
jgi:hypothetical protein